MKAKQRDLAIFLAKTGRPAKTRGYRYPTTADLARPMPAAAQPGAARRAQGVRPADHTEPSEGAGGTTGRPSRKKARKGKEN